MAQKEKTNYTCTECGGISPKWLGKCPHCTAWNTLMVPRGVPMEIQNKLAIEMRKILDLPETYTPGNVYTIRVQLESSANADSVNRRWGFQLTAVKASDGSGVGTFLLRSLDSLQIREPFPGDPWEGRQYVEHTSLGIHETESSPAEWSFQWQAPPTPAGAVYFYVAGNAADGSQDPGGDWIYTSGDTMADTTTATRPTSWGGLKKLWR